MSIKFKYGSDKFVGAGLLLIAAPVIAVAAVAIKRESRGPVFFRQPRLGENGEVFSIWKLRTMTDGADKSGLSTHQEDVRITRVGSILRRSRIDELPQLINVLNGQMSLVGPRPTLPFQYDYYTESEARRVNMRPGMTGWTQVNGGNRLTWDERIEMDVWYVDNWSLWLDIRILVLTIREVCENLLGKKTTYTSVEGGWTRHIPDDPYTNSVTAKFSSRQEVIKPARVP